MRRMFVTAIATLAIALTATSSLHAGTVQSAQGRLIVNGTPRFVLGVYDSGLGYSNDPATYERTLFAPGANRLAGLPINMYLNYQWGQAPIGSMNALMDTLQRHGITYLQTANCFDGGSHKRIPFAVDQSDAYAQQFGAHPGAAGYYVMDECKDSLIPETTAHSQHLQAVDPSTMTLAVTLARGYVDPRRWVGAADVLGTDPYPLFGAEPSQGYAHFQVADFVAQLRAAAPANQPIFTVLQFFKFTSDSRFPTPDEYRSHAVMAIVEGAQGLFWWEIGANGLRKSDGGTVATQLGYLRALTGELARLEPALLAYEAPDRLVGNSTRFADPVAGRKAQLQHDIATDPLYSDKDWYRAELDRLNAGDTSRSPMLSGAATIRTKVTVVGGKGYVFAYNYTNQATPVTLTWYTAPGSVTESRDGRSFEVSGSSWSDTFGPYEARIYVIDNGGADTAFPGAANWVNGPEGTIPIYRFYNTATGTHFYTASAAERDAVTALPGFNLEGVAYFAFPSDGPGRSAVYRFFNTASGTHFYTISAAERDNIIARLPSYHYEGVAYYAYASPTPGAQAVYRFYNTLTGTHFYTGSVEERDHVIATLPALWFEGAAYYLP